MKFDPLFLSPQWLQEYQTKYPHGMSILENIIEWVNKTNDLVDYVNMSPDRIEDLFDDRVQDGTLETLINNYLLSNKADISYVDSKVSAVASGSPKGVYNTKADLETAIPNGSNNIYVVLSDNSWYFWNGTAWSRGGEYLKDLSRSLMYKRFLTSDDNLDSVLDMGVYYVQSSSMPSNMPEKRTCVIVVFKPTADAFSYGAVQMVFNAEKTYIRYKSSAGWNSWQKIGESEIPIGGYDYIIMKDGVKKSMQPWVVKKPLTDARTGTVYNTNEVVKTIPYQSRFSFGRDILFNSNLNAFYSMVQNPASDIYTSGDFGYYGSVCSTISDYLCGQDIYHTTEELKRSLDFYEYSGGSCLRIGDNMLREGHSRVISDIITDSSGEVIKVGVAESGGPILYYTMYSLSDFENLLTKYGGVYDLGRFEDYKPRQLDKVEYPTDCIPSKGHKSYYRLSETVKIMVTSGKTNLYYRKKGGVYNTTLLSALPSEEVNGVMVYNITSLLNSNGVWEVTTSPTNKPNEILLYTLGTITVNGDKFSVNGYSSELKPLWYQIIILENGGRNQNYPKPTGYSARLDYHNKHYITNPSETSFVIYNEDIDEYINQNVDGYYIRVLMQSPFGQIPLDSNFIIL